MQRIFGVVLLLFLFACTSTSPVETAQINGQPVSIVAEGQPGVLTGTFVLKFNNTVVINERTKLFGGSSQTFNGRYQGKQVMARVTRVVSFLSERYVVDVFYNGQLIETTSI